MYFAVFCIACRSYSSSPTESVPSGAEIVVCGGGVIGSSIAYHLAHMGASDVLLLEQGRYVICLAFKQF